MKRPDLDAMLAELQRELRLLDWQIAIEYVRDLSTSDGRPVHGLCSHLVDAKRAHIQIRDPETPAGDADPPVDETLIHELIHLHFAPLSGSTQAEIAVEEQAVWALSEALHSAKTASRKAQIARAMVAHGSEARGRSARRPQIRKQQRSNMDLAMLIAALEAAVASGDMAQVEATLAKMKETLGAGGEAAPPAEQEAGEEPPMAQDAGEDEPKAQEASEEPPKAQRAQRPVAKLAGKPAGARPVTAAEFDRFKAEQHVEAHGKHLNEAQKRLAATMSYAQVRAYIATTPATAPNSAQRNQRPAGGAAPGAKRSGLPDKERAQLAAAMGLRTQSIGGPRILEDGRLEIQTLRPRDFADLMEAAKAAGKAG